MVAFKGKGAMINKMEMITDQPEISVIMCVYNTKEEYLREAIQSILNQTFKNYEFIIINDASDIKTVEILKQYKDRRIKLITNNKNVGLTASLNIGLKHAIGKYIARMDSDDYSYENRFEKQYNYMEKHLKIDILGSWVNENEKINFCGGIIPTECRKVKMLFLNYGIVHSTAFIRKSFLEKNQLMYDENIKKAQDYKLWVDCFRKGATMNVYPEVLVKYRTHEKQISKVCVGEQNQYMYLIKQDLITELAPDISEIEKKQMIYPDKQILSKQELNRLFVNLEKQNCLRKLYSEKILHYELIDYWKKIWGYYWHIEFGYFVYRIVKSIYKHWSVVF